MGIYTLSDEDLTDIHDYLRSQHAKGLPSRISALLDAMETSQSACRSHEQISGSSAYQTPLPTPQSESPIVEATGNSTSSNFTPVSVHQTHLPRLADEASVRFVVVSTTWLKLCNKGEHYHLCWERSDAYECCEHQFRHWV
jgi:hypothetical protein